MRKLHTRVIVLTYFEDEVPLHGLDKEVHEWHAALGRMVSFDLYHRLNSAEDDTMQYVGLWFRKDPVEIDACYHKPIQQERDEDRNIKYESQYEKARLTCFRLGGQLLCDEPSFTMGAVLHQDGKWGFHS